MGSFDYTCGLSGLSIKAGDPIRFGIIGDNWSLKPRYVTGNYTFWTPIFKSTYNDYGYFEEKDLKNKPLWDWWTGKMRPYIKPKENSSSMKPKTYDGVVRELMEQRQYLFVGRRFVDEKPYKTCHIWMAHEWACAELESYKIETYSSEDPAERCRKSLSCWLNRGSYKKFKDPKKISEAAMKESLDIMECGPGAYIEADTGLFDHGVKLLFDKGKGTIREQIPAKLRKECEDLICESAMLVVRMDMIRKGVLPMTAYGEQIEQNEFLKPWTKLVAKKAEEQCKEMRAG